MLPHWWYVDWLVRNVNIAKTSIGSAEMKMVTLCYISQTSHTLPKTDSMLSSFTNRA